MDVGDARDGAGVQRLVVVCWGHLEKRGRQEKTTHLGVRQDNMMRGAAISKGRQGSGIEL